MADLNKNSVKIKSAYNEIRNATSSNRWVVFGYEGQSNVIHVAEIGDDWDDLVSEMSGSKIFYIYARMKDPNTGLDKFVIINWSGAAVPPSLKGPRAYHIPDMARFFGVAHVTINARDDDDLDEALILNKLSKSSGSNYSVHKEKPKKFEETGPVGSVYKKTNAKGEIFSSGRNNFWQNQEEEEKKRLVTEANKSSRIRAQDEQERKDRELQENMQRTQVAEQKFRDIDAQKARERDVLKNEQDDRKRREEDEFKSELSQQGNTSHNISSYRQEAANLPSRVPHNAPRFAKPVPEPEPEPEYEPEPEPEPEHISAAPIAPMRPPLPEEVTSQNYDDQDEYQDDLTYDTLVDETDTSQQQQGDVYESVIEDTEQTNAYQPEVPAEDIYDEIGAEVTPQGCTVRALYDYQASDDTEISFDPGDIITNVEMIDEGWWQGLAPDGQTVGLFPANYVELVQ